MIQRIQSLLLFLVAALAAALFFFPVFVIKIPAAAGVQALPYMIQSNMLTSIAVVLTGLLALISIFLYKNRHKQILLCRLNMLFIIASEGLILQASDTSTMPKLSGHATVEYSFAVILPLLQIIFDMLATRYIRKDDELVRSADRLR